MNIYIHNQKGMVLVLSLSIMTLLFFLTTMFLWMSDTERNISVNQRDATQAFYLAEAGLEHGIGYLNHTDPNWRTPTDPDLTATLTTGSYTVTCIDDPLVSGGMIVTSTGEVGYAKRTTKANVTLSGKPIHALFSNTDIDRGLPVPATGSISGDIHTNGDLNLDYPASVTIAGTITQGGIPMPTVNMESYEDAAFAQEPNNVYTGDQVFTPTDKSSIDGQIIYVKADPSVEGDTGHVTIRSTNKAIKFSNCVIAAEGGFLLEGSNRNITLTPLSGWSLLATKTGHIIEQESSAPLNRSLKGLIVTEEGTIQFENIQLQGTLMANYIDLTEKIAIQYKPKQVPDNPPGVIGGGSVTKWRETY